MIERLTMKLKISKQNHSILCLSMVRNTKYTEQTRLNIKSGNLNGILGLYSFSSVTSHNVTVTGYPPAVLENRNRGLYYLADVE